MTEQLIIITGPPGSGKTTIARLVAERFDRCALVDGDAFFRSICRGYVDPWLPEAHDQNGVVTEAAAAATGRFSRGGYMTVYDGMVGPWFLSTFLEHAGLDRASYAVLMPDVEECIRRIRDRGGHGFRDESATRQMHASFSDAEIDERHLIADVQRSPTAIANEVLERLASGELFTDFATSHDRADRTRRNR